MATTRGREVEINQTVLDQADFFEADEFTRVVGLTAVDLTSEIFHQNILQPWALVDGTTVTDEEVASGTVYVHEITGSPGFYSVRFRPNALGFWRNSLTFAAGTQVLAQDFDVVARGAIADTGLKVSFVKP